ncbi:ESX secretion-associated protein EspG [Pseudonocardia sp. NPDC046786]|uniref:ESX secretion-associated protein EspG n=1 Tax=Pseudonocardia sp. NPDC046786 TaxID=3155471 RepID=UPI0033E4A997
MAEWDPATRFRLTAAEFDVVWELLGLGTTPAALSVPSPGRSTDERTRGVAAVTAALRDRGLAGPRGHAPGLVRLCTLLARPERQLEVRARYGSALRAVAAGSTDGGVLAVHTGGTVIVAAAGSPAHAAVSVLPPAHPGPGPAAGMPTAELALLLSDGTDETAGTGGTERSGPSARLEAVLRGPARHAQVCAVRFDRWGNPARLPGYVTVVDTARGRYRLTRDAEPGPGPEWVTLAPVSPQALRALLDQLFGDQSRSECCIS